MTAEEDIEYDRSLLGKKHLIGSFPVTREMILEFSTSTGETHPLYCDEALAKASKHGDLIAPPTFCNIFMAGFTRPDIKLAFGDLTLFASQAIENLAPIKPGDTLEVNTKLKEVYAKTGRSGKMVFAVWETDFTNQTGETAILVRDAYVRRERQKR
ncbi:MAG: MaoC family dehydratase N-terminal domain-containing protein [bacterium]|nr:MaoC family dehydratase N-terminal domain-containing protein [bacterium]